jgi:hypothetical protein
MLFLLTSFFLIALTMAVGVGYTVSLYIERVFREK